ncbi:MAG: hypothetical protein AAGU11_00915 [Syntrophobacteraceae bacterium]
MIDHGDYQDPFGEFREQVLWADAMETIWLQPSEIPEEFIQQYETAKQRIQEAIGMRWP